MSDLTLQTPHWLLKAHFKEPQHHLDLRDVIINDYGEEQHFAAIGRARQCAERAILGAAFDAVCGTLPYTDDCDMQAEIRDAVVPQDAMIDEDKDKPIPIPDEELQTVVTSPERKAAVHKMLQRCFDKDIFKYYIANWGDNAEADAMHYTQTEIKGTAVAVANIFLAPRHINALPTSEEHSWTALDKRRIMLLAWHIMHELSHAIGSVLAHENVISFHRTPEKFSAFEGRSSPYNPAEQLLAGTLRRYGERGWWVQDKMGGHMRMKDDDFPLLLWRPERAYPLRKWYVIRQEIVDTFVACDHRFDQLLPLALDTVSPTQFTKRDTLTFKCRGWHSLDKEQWHWPDKI